MKMRRKINILLMLFCFLMALMLNGCNAEIKETNAEIKESNVEIKESNVFYAYFDENDSSTLIITSDESKGKVIKIDEEGQWRWDLFYGIDRTQEDASIVQDEQNKIYKIVIGNKIKPISAHSMFDDFVNLKTIVNLDNIDLKDVTNFRNMFSNCENLMDVDLSTNVPQNPKDMSYMFYECKNMKLNLHNWVMNSETKYINIFKGSMFPDLKFFNEIDYDFDKATHLKLEDYISSSDLRIFCKEICERSNIGPLKWAVKIKDNEITMTRTELEGRLLYTIEDQMKQYYRGNAYLLGSEIFRLKDSVIINFEHNDTYGNKYAFTVSSGELKVKDIPKGFTW